MKEEDYTRPLLELHEPDPLRRAASKLEAAANSLFPRMTDIEKRMENVTGAMATHRDLSDFRAERDRKLESFAHNLAEDTAELTRKVVAEFFDKFVREDLPRLIATGLSDIREREAEHRRIEDERVARIRQSRREAWRTRLAIVIAALSVLSTLWAFTVYVWEVI